jgi:hypothetical protein
MMRHANLTLCLILAASTPLFAHAAPAPTRPTRTSGSAQSEGGYSVAGPDGAEWTLPGGPRVKASAGTRVRILQTPQPLTLGPGITKPGYTVVFKDGRVDVKIPDKAKSAVVLTGPRKTIALIASGHTAARATDQRVAIASYGGNSSVSVDAGGFRALSAGEVSIVEGAQKQHRPLTASPRYVRGSRVLVAFSGSSPMPDLSWPAQPGATAYRLELIEAGKTEPRETIESTETKVARPFGNLEPGVYALRVSAIDDTGLESAQPLEAPVRVLGGDLPDGAYVDSGNVVRLAPRQRVKLSNFEGVEISYGSGKWLTGGQSIAMTSGGATRVRFRLKGTGDVAIARLAPRQERAEVVIGPKTAVWPTDPIDIRIRLSHTSAHSVVEMKPTVTVGIEEVPVSFHRDGEWLKATLRPRPGKGPWVVRVEVEDQFGLPLGRDFVEITRKSASEPRSLKLASREPFSFSKGRARK